MSSIRSRGNRTTEITFVGVLRSRRITGWRRHLLLPGKPDFVFSSWRLAVFIDGCFWHGCPRCYRMPEDNRPYWSAKVAGNRRRDRRNARELRRRGWKVLRVWEHALKTTTGRARAADRLARSLALLREKAA